MTQAIIAPMEEDGYALPERMLPAISQGRMFCGFLRDEFDIDTDKLPTYEHLYEHGRVIRAKAYPQALWYLPRLLPKKPPLWGR
jgi:hypothetical protein